LIELNHDQFRLLESPGFAAAVGRYLRSGSREDAEKLERFGCRVVGMRHHADKFIIDADAEGFPPQYLKAQKTC
jgi:hypothetical protein